MAIRKPLIKKQPALEQDPYLEGITLKLLAVQEASGENITRDDVLNSPNALLLEPQTPDSPMYLYMELRGRIRIDRDNLDTAVEEQAQVYLEVCERHIATMAKRDELKDQLGKRDAELAVEIRAEIEAENKRATEASVADRLISHPEHIVLNDQYRTYKIATESWASLRESFEQRLKMIQLLVNLYQTGYFGASNGVAASGQRNVVRDALAATAKEKMEAQRRARTERP